MKIIAVIQFSEVTNYFSQQMTTQPIFKLATAMLCSAILFTTSCKKGEDDPFLSLQTRKARITGDWIVSTYTSQKQSTFSDEFGTTETTSASTNNYTITNGVYASQGTYQYNSPNITINETSSGSGTVNISFTFNKNGTFTKTVEYVNVSTTTVDSGNSNTQEESFIETHSGTWNFLGGIDEDFKNKERILLSIVNYTRKNTGPNQVSTDGITQTYSNGMNTEVWQLTQLKNSTMALLAELNRTSVTQQTFDFGAGPITSTGTSTTTGIESGTLEKQ